MDIVVVIIKMGYMLIHAVLVVMGQYLRLVNWSDGATGSTGPTGSTGDTGPTGSTGVTGATIQQDRRE